jgi:long-chain fatty acid transport protein
MRINKVAFAVTSLLVAGQVNAAGFLVNEHSASGLGRAFAGEAAIGDNAASLARNPALMATFNSAQLSVAGIYVAPDISIEGVDIPGHSPSVLDADDIAPSQFVPSMYYIQPLNDTFAAGLAIYSNYGTGTEFESDYAGGAAAGTTKIMTININPNLSLRVNEYLSFGAGVSLVYADAELKRNAGLLALYTNPVYNVTSGTNVAKMEGDGYGFGWNVGALLEFNQDHRIGVSYKAKVNCELEGDFTGVSSDNKKVTGELELNLPSILEVSGYHKLTDKFAMSYSWQYVTWSDFEEINAESLECENGVCIDKKENFDNSSRYAVGAEYYTSDTITLRAGYAFDEQAGAATLSIPDADRQWYTAGMTIKSSDALSFDLGAAFVAGKEVTFDEDMNSDLPLKATLTSSGDAYIYSAQMNYRL